MTEIKFESVKSIAVVGAGACGTAAIKSLLQEKAFDRIVGFERRSSTGGLWHYYSETYNSKKAFDIPSLNAHDPTSLISVKVSENEFIWPTAVYESLDTNVPYPLMEFNDTKFPKGTILFPTKDQVLEYIQEYSKDIKDYIKFDTNVVDVQYFPEKETKKWQITYRKVCDRTEGGLIVDEEEPDSIELFDAVLLASGHYDLPFTPDKKGLKEWSAKYPNSVSHAKNFKHHRQLENLEGNIVVVGNSASGIDISFQLASKLQRPIYKSARSEIELPGATCDLIRTVGDIELFDAPTKSIKFTDGTVLENVDHILFATGYLRYYPYLKTLNESDKPLITNGERIHGLYRQILSYNYPGLAFIVTPRYILPNKLSETQGAWIAKVLSNKIQLPSVEQMEAEEDKLLAERGDCPKFHNMMYPEDVLYSLELNKEIYSVPGWENGMVPTKWTEEEIATRASIIPLKEAYYKYKDMNNGEGATSIEQLQKCTDFKFLEIDRELFGLE